MIAGQLEQLTKGRSVNVDEWVRILLICKYMGWDYETYNRQPLPFIQAAEYLNEAEAKQQKK